MALPSGQGTTSLHSHPPPHSRNVTRLPHLIPPVNYTLLSQKLPEQRFKSKVKLLTTSELRKEKKRRQLNLTPKVDFTFSPLNMNTDFPRPLSGIRSPHWNRCIKIDCLNSSCSQVLNTSQEGAAGGWVQESRTCAPPSSPTKSEPVLRIAPAYLNFCHSSGF